ncbi:MAG: proline--tRNA ligase, partial [Alphaproteobacteria bacterium]|nr:proline--tRNA ligase [Alphaproteobacteria bacterium]
MINQWANVVRWEMRPRIFLRTREFLWQEGHTAHSTYDEAQAEAKQMLKVYVDFAENCLAIPVIPGVKPEHEKFPGAVDTYTFEPMMQDGRALQAGTSHFLGQTFAKSANIKFQNKNGEWEYAYTTS